MSEGSIDLKPDGALIFKVSKPYAIYALALLAMTHAVDLADRLILGAILPAIQKEWGIKDTMAGGLQTIMLIIMVLAAPTIGIIIDRWSRRKTVAIMVFVWSLACFACSFVRRFWHLITLRAILGLGEAGYNPGSVTILSSIFPKEKRSFVQGIFYTGNPIGGAIGILLGGWIAHTYGWRYAFGLMAFPGFICALLIWRLKDYKNIDLTGVVKGSSKENIKKPDSLTIVKDHILKTPSLLFNFLGSGMAGFCGHGLMYWLPTYFVRYYDMNMKTAGMRSSIIILAGIIGTPLGGFIADQLYRRKPWLRQACCGFAMIGAAAGIFLALTVHNPLLTLVFFFLGAGCITMYLGPNSAVVQSVVHPGMRGTAQGLLSTGTHLLGGAWASMVVGFVSDMTGRLDVAMYLFSAAALLSALWFFIGCKYYEKDESKYKDFIIMNEVTVK